MTLIIILVLIHSVFWFLTTNFLERANDPKRTSKDNLVAGFFWEILWPLAIIVAIIKLIVFLIKGALGR